MRKKRVILIELLAVIVILSLIAIPIVLKIEQARYGAAKKGSVGEATIDDVGSYVSYTPDNATWNPEKDGVFESESTGPGMFNIYDYKTSKSASGLGKDKSITCYSSFYQTKTEGWQIMDVSSSGQITLIHGGTPECYTHDYGKSEASKTILRKEATSTSNEGEGKAWTKYGSNLAQSIHYMTELDYNTILKNKNGNSNYYIIDMDYSGSTCYTKMPQAECGKGYDMIDIGSFYWLASAYDSDYLYYWFPGAQAVAMNAVQSYGVRPVIILKSTVKIKSGTGDKSNPYVLTT